MIVVAIIGILAAIAIPNFIKFQAKSKQSEAKTNLKGLFQAERSFYAEHDGYATNFAAAGFIPERGNRYTYAIGSGTTQSRSAAATGTETEPVVISVDVFKYPGMVVGTFAQNSATITPDNVPTAAACPGVITGSSGAFCGTAVGTVDNDTEMDSWAIGGSQAIVQVAGPCADQNNGASGIPVNTYNDVTCP
jgi:type IV pilus assembly protein PilA